MKLIHKFKSPNFNERKSPKILFIVIHYTALKSITKSISYLCSKKNKVSCHYLISKKGEIYSLVSEKKRAWHAGYSYWNGISDINSSSIGIELDYIPSLNKNKFNSRLTNSLILLLNKITKKHKIKPENILGHSDIAPYRKIDPGKYFPWKLLQNKKLVFEIKNIKQKKTYMNLINAWFFKKGFNSKKKRILFMLNYIGYDVSLALNNKLYYSQIILMYSYRYKYYKNTSYNKKNIFNVIQLHFLNIVLTKFKKKLKILIDDAMIA